MRISRFAAAIYLGTVVLGLSGCATSTGNLTPIDQVPMYGGMDRAANPRLKKGDDEFIGNVTRHYGSREKASIAFAEQGFAFYQRNENAKAMRRFNQAWLLNPNNPDAYWGFSVVAHDKGEYCEAIDLMETGLSKGPLHKSYMPDLAVLYAACALHGNLSTGQEQQRHYDRSNELFLAAEQDSEVSKPYLYFQWARTNNALGRYDEAWAAVKKYREHTDEPFDRELLDRLSKNAPEPK